MNKICSHPPTDFHYEASCFAALVWIDHVWSCVCTSEGLESGKDIHAITQSSHQTNNLASKAEICKKLSKKKKYSTGIENLAALHFFFSPYGFVDFLPLFLSLADQHLNCLAVAMFGRAEAAVGQMRGGRGGGGGCNSLIWQCGDIGVWKCLLNA